MAVRTAATNERRARRPIPLRVTKKDNIRTISLVEIGSDLFFTAIIQVNTKCTAESDQTVTLAGVIIL